MHRECIKPPLVDGWLLPSAPGPGRVFGDIEQAVDDSEIDGLVHHWVKEAREELVQFQHAAMLH